MPHFSLAPVVNAARPPQQRAGDAQPASLKPASPPRSAVEDDGALLCELLSRSLPPASCALAVAALIDRFGSAAAVLGADPGEIQRSGPIPDEALADLMVMRRLAIALARADASRKPVLSSWSVLLAYLRADLAHAPREQFRTLFLDKKNRLLRDEIASAGTVDHAPVYVREVVRRALELSASAMILVHNHPSGDPEPSRADIEMTRKIVEAAKLFEIEVHDHFVIGRDGTASLRTLGHFP